MIVFLKAHPATQALSARHITQAELREAGQRGEAGQYRNPGEPGAAEAEASTYSKPRIEWQGLTIAIENPAGSVRRGRNRHGVTWEVRMRFDYGEILGTLGVDGDPVDIIMGPNLDAPTVYVVHQRRVNDWKEYDEDKCCAGFDSQADAEQAFLSNYNDPRFLGPVTAMPVAEFVAKVRATKNKPAMIKAHVSGYTRKDGSVVPPHEDKRQSLQEDLGRQEKWLHAQAHKLGFTDIEDLLANDYPAFEHLAKEWRDMNPVEVAMKSLVLFFKSHVGAYLRGGKMVNVNGYQGRTARAVATPGQMGLFSSNTPMGPSPFKGKDPVASTPDLFDADEHGEVPPGRSAYRDEPEPAAAPPQYQPTTSDDHPAPMPRSLLSSVPEDQRDEWKDLHRQQHELHHYELGQVREKMGRVRSKLRTAENPMREMERAASDLRASGMPGSIERADDADASAGRYRAEFLRHKGELDGLIGTHQNLYERVAKLGRAKDKILTGSGDMDRDFASMATRSAPDQADHEKSMLKMYRQHYKDMDAARRRKPEPMAKSIIFIRPPAS